MLLNVTVSIGKASNFGRFLSADLGPILHFTVAIRVRSGRFRTDLERLFGSSRQKRRLKPALPFKSSILSEAVMSMALVPNREQVGVI